MRLIRGRPRCSSLGLASVTLRSVLSLSCRAMSSSHNEERSISPSDALPKKIVNMGGSFTSILRTHASQTPTKENPYLSQDVSNKNEEEIRLWSAKVKLTDNEQSIISLLLKFVEVNDLKVVLRIAGGWVRDKVSSASQYGMALPGMAWSGMQSLYI